MIRIAAILFAVAAVAAAPASEKYYIGHHTKFVNITFESDADLETIVGTSNEAEGMLQVDLEKQTGSIEVKVPVKSLKTGIATRDEHLRAPNWLDEAKHPHIIFKSKKIKPVKNKKRQLEVIGDFTMHGVKKEYKVIVKWAKIPESVAKKNRLFGGGGDWLKFSTSLDVKLSDHGVKVPSGIVAKVSDTWKVRISLFAGTQKPKK